MPAHWAGTSVPSPIMRTNRAGGNVGTSPGINPITPYTTAALDYRASWIAGEMVKTTKDSMASPAHADLLWAETMRNEAKSVANSMARPAVRTVLPAPHRGPSYRESNGLERSLSTNIPDHPTAIQVNGLRQERVVDMLCPGHIYGVATYDSRTLCGNWAEERCDKSYTPSQWKAPSGSDWQWKTTYGEQTKHTQGKVLPGKGSNAATMYSHPGSQFATGTVEESLSSNSEIIALGGTPGVDYQPGDHRSASRFPGNYVNYQCGKQHTVSVIGGRTSQLTPYETTTAAAFSHSKGKHMAASSERCDVFKPPFQIRDPGRDGKSKMLCGIRSEEFGCERDDATYLTTHVLGNPVPNKQKAYTLSEYRAKWTKSAPEIVAAGAQDTSEHRTAYQTPDLNKLDPGKLRPGHVGSWH